MSVETTVFVDGLPGHLTSEQFQSFFAAYGSYRVIMATSQAGSCLGFGFVVFATPGQASHAIDVLNGADMMGRRIWVSRKIQPRPTGYAA